MAVMVLPEHRVELGCGHHAQEERRPCQSRGCHSPKRTRTQGGCSEHHLCNGDDKRRGDVKVAKGQDRSLQGAAASERPVAPIPQRSPVLVVAAAPLPPFVVLGRTSSVV